MENSQSKDKSTYLFGALANIIKDKQLNDGFYNSRMKIGENDANLVYSKWQYERTFLDWFLWTTLYTQSWVFRNGIDKKSDATVADIEIESDADPSEINNVLTYYRKYQKNLKYLVRQGMIYGGAAAAILVEGNITEEKLKQPLNVSKIKKGAKLTLYTRDRWNGLQWEGTAGYEALGTDDFGKHDFYKFYITGDTGKNIDHIKFHHSQVLRCGNRAPVKFTQYQLAGWDLPEGQHLLEELTRDETTRASIASLVSKSLIEIVKMPGIRGLFSGISGDLGSNSIESRSELEGRIKAVTDYRNFNNLSFLDKDDEYQQFQLGGMMTGLADILEQQRKATSGAMEIPEMILYGSADKKGLIFQKDGSQSPEIEIYQQTINNRQDYVLRPILDKLLPILWRIANGKDMPEGTTYEFIPIFKESQTAKLERASLVVNNALNLLKDGVFSPRDVAVEIRQYSKQTGFGTNLTDDRINRLSDEVVDIQSQNEANNTDVSPNVDANPNNDKLGQQVKPRNQQKETKYDKKNYKFERRGGKR